MTSVSLYVDVKAETPQKKTIMGHGHLRQQTKSTKTDSFIFNSFIFNQLVSILPPGRNISLRPNIHSNIRRNLATLHCAVH